MCSSYMDGQDLLSMIETRFFFLVNSGRHCLTCMALIFFYHQPAILKLMVGPRWSTSVLKLILDVCVNKLQKNGLDGYLY